MKQWCERIAKLVDYDLAQNQICPLGFDLEWKPNRQVGQDNPVNLIQVCYQDEVLLYHAVYVFRGRYITVNANDLQPLIDLLTKDGVLLCGTAVKQDAKKMIKDFNIPEVYQQKILDNCHDLKDFAQYHYYLKSRQQIVTQSRIEVLVASKYLSMVEMYYSSLTQGSGHFNKYVKYRYGIKVKSIDGEVHGNTSVYQDAAYQLNLLEHLEMLCVDDVKQYCKSHELGEELPELDEFDGASAFPNGDLHLPLPAKNAKYGLKVLMDRFKLVSAESNLNPPAQSYRNSTSCTNWEFFPLNVNQIKYAAMDAYAGHELLKCILYEISRLLQLDLSQALSRERFNDILALQQKQVAESKALADKQKKRSQTQKKPVAKSSSPKHQPSEDTE
ncbi:hypothetical protein MP228_001599 [Amoeboaphelidium protococcarum]|nr:hypothetical protein MP228_001599 [Amoeboaphelidium protococcarum]